MGKIKEHILNFLKGFAMGGANVIPGVSGGTIAIIAGIFERLINSLKSFDLKAIKLVFKGKFKEFAKHTDLIFLIVVFLGAAVSILTLAKLLGYLFDFYPVYVWAYFFGLIIASVYFVAKTVERWKISVILFFILGTAIAISLSFLKPAVENDNVLYVFICGVLGICSMILPGLSGSFILVLLGNYRLLMIDTMINITKIMGGNYELITPTLKLLLPLILGMVVGLLAFSHFLSWIFKKYKDQTIAILSGFILGSLIIIWPWKKSYDIDMNYLEVDKFGAFTSDKSVDVFFYERIMPDFNIILIWSIIIAIAGFFTIWIIEKSAKKKTDTTVK